MRAGEELEERVKGKKKERDVEETQREMRLKLSS